MASSTALAQRPITVKRPKMTRSEKRLSTRKTPPVSTGFRHSTRLISACLDATADVTARSSGSERSADAIRPSPLPLAERSSSMSSSMLDGRSVESYALEPSSTLRNGESSKGPKPLCAGPPEIEGRCIGCGSARASSGAPQESGTCTEVLSGGARLISASGAGSSSSLSGKRIRYGPSDPAIRGRFVSL